MPRPSADLLPPVAASLTSRLAIWLRGVWLQWALALLLAGALWALARMVAQHLEEHSVAAGFGFLREQAGFAIADTPLAFDPTQSYGRALLAGLLNSLMVSACATVGGAVLGLVIALLRQSPSGLGRGLGHAYVHGLRNIPLLLQLILWHTVITRLLPGPRQAWVPLPHVYLSNRGLVLPALQADGWVWAALLVGAVGGWLLRRRVGWWSLLALALPLLVFWGSGEGLRIDLPQLAGFNFRGGTTVSPEFVALTGGLIVYSAAFLAEIFRAGLESVPTGQREAALSLGLSPLQTLFLVVLPQALRLMVPLLANQALTIVKNSTLAVAIGFADFVAVANTVITQTGHAVEGVTLIMAVYLTLSLSIAAFAQLYNRRILARGGAVSQGSGGMP